jgi:transcriptional regulator
VPTWNYTAVHVYGAARVLDDPGHTARHVEALAAKYERGSPAPWVPDYDPRRLGGIVGIEIGIRSIEGKFKLSQNRSAADRAGVIAKLRANGRDDETALAGLMESLP